VEDRLSEVNDRLYKESVARSAVIGSTIAMLVALERHAIALWAGDSRIYRTRSGALTQVTHDHSEIQQMIDEGSLTPEQAKQHASANVITRAVGGAAELALDLRLTDLADEDAFLLCTDGLYRELPDSTLNQSLQRRNPGKACKKLIDLALEGECRDNVSALVVQFAAS
jgi:serine/threonine-protein phosphatase Stp1